MSALINRIGKKCYIGAGVFCAGAFASHLTGSSLIGYGGSAVGGVIVYTSPRLSTLSKPFVMVYRGAAASIRCVLAVGGMIVDSSPQLSTLGPRIRETWVDTTEKIGRFFNSRQLSHFQLGVAMAGTMVGISALHTIGVSHGVAIISGGMLSPPAVLYLLNRVGYVPLMDPLPEIPAHPEQFQVTDGSLLHWDSICTPIAVMYGDPLYPKFVRCPSAATACLCQTLTPECRQRYAAFFETAATTADIARAFILARPISEIDRFFNLREWTSYYLDQKFDCIIPVRPGPRPSRTAAMQQCRDALVNTGEKQIVYDAPMAVSQQVKDAALQQAVDQILEPQQLSAIVTAALQSFRIQQPAPAAPLGVMSQDDRRAGAEAGSRAGALAGAQAVLARMNQDYRLLAGALYEGALRGAQVGAQAGVAAAVGGNAPQNPAMVAGSNAGQLRGQQIDLSSYCMIANQRFPIDLAYLLTEIRRIIHTQENSEA